MAASLADGRVLVLSGRGSAGILASAEIYNPISGIFSAAGPMLAGRLSSTATLLLDGRVLVAGGGDASGPFPVLANPSAELFDPITGTFAAGPAMREPRMFLTATALTDGSVLLTGGEKPGQILRTAELFVPGCETFTWDPHPAAKSYDVVKGGIASLHSTGGNFTVSLLQCVEDDGDLRTTDTATPAPGDGFYYLVRGNNRLGVAGTYDDGTPSQVGSRDAEIAAAATACP